MNINLFDPRIDQEAAKVLISGETIPVFEYEVAVITDGKRIGTDGGIFPGPFKDQTVWMSLYENVQVAISNDVDPWVLTNLNDIAPDLRVYPHKVGMVSLKVAMGVSDDGQPYLNAEYTALSDYGKRFINSSSGERARLMALDMAGGFIDRLGRGDQA